MATSSNLSSIIRYYAEKTKSPFIDFREFCAYIKKYAEHHIEEQAELVKYLGDPAQTVSAELQGLADKHLVSVIQHHNKKVIVSISFFAVKFAEQYKECLTRDTTLFPLITDLPKLFPITALEHKYSQNYIASLIEKPTPKSPVLYVLDFEREIPSLLLPACVPINVLIEVAQKKIKKILKKEEFHDYFLKKLRGSNPTKEIGIKNFFKDFVDSQEYKFVEFSEGDTYYLWNQLLYLIRQDFEKIQDRTVDDINILQAIQICENQSVYLKHKFQEEQKRDEALKELQTNLAKSPYFYSMNQILKFQDQNGRLLYGRYNDEELKQLLQTLTTDGAENELPKLLVFKVESGTRYYVYKAKVIQLVIRLCNETHDAIKEILEKRWYDFLLNYEKIPEMTEAKAFELKLEELVRENSPVLFSLLNANFMAMLAYEKQTDDAASFQLFVNGQLLPYSELLMLKQSKILANAKGRLPFTYTIPILSWIIGFFTNRSRMKKKKAKASQEQIEESRPETHKSNSQKKQIAMAEQAVELSKEFVPEGSTMDRELNYLAKQWNRMITKEAYNNLTDDVNSLIRDYTRRVAKTLSSVSFTKDRILNLAETLCKTPNMQKIKDQDALVEYVALYILRLISNSKK